MKFLHVREINTNLEIQPFGGITIAYVVVDSPEVAGICLNLAKCHQDDHFCYETGRKIASEKLAREGPLTVLSINHPISVVIIDWLSNEWLPSRRKYCGYSVDIFIDNKHRWVSDFTPSQPEIISEDT